MNYPAIALASSSPRRRELLAQLGVNYKLVKADIDETVLPDEAAAVYVQRLALAKAHAGLTRLQHDLPVLGADTVVVVDGLILGKPADFEQYKQGLINQLLQRPQTLEEETSRYSNDFNRNNFAFDSREKMIAHVKQLNSTALADFFQQAVIKPQGLALLSQVKGQGQTAGGYAVPKGWTTYPTTSALQATLPQKVLVP